MNNRKILERGLKGIIDYVGASLFLLLFCIPMICIALAIRIESKGPALFKQQRVGRNGESFALYKFRSMKIINEQENLFYDESRITRMGKLLRRWRVDEMPQFLNVLKGDMSIVGPRPTLAYQIKKYSNEQKRRLEVLPGVTGWAQIHGDKAISWPDRIALDIWYIDNWSILLDLKILLTTPYALLRIRSINVEEASPPDEISELPTSSNGTMEVKNVD